MKGHVLIVDDDRSMCEMLAGALEGHGFRVTWKTSGEEAMLALQGAEIDAVVTDLNMHGMSGLDLCHRVVENRPDIPVVVVTAFGSLETAVGAIRAGAYDFLTKPFDIDQVVVALQRVVQHAQLGKEVKRLREEVSSAGGFPEIIGSSPPMRRVFDLVERVAETAATVLITGESGTGKELVAHAIHQRSGRRGGPFVAVNCAAMPEQLLESELFGHVKGAFTDAKATRTGLFVKASGGTLFLDEIGELPIEMQAKLLRALQERTVRPVGGDREIPFDARLITATNRDLEHDVEERRFRQDLYYRINVVNIRIPPLCARGNDILLLAQVFIDELSKKHGKEVTGLSPAAAEKLLAYDWPGNVRELQNGIERAVALTRYREIAVEDLPDKLREYKSWHVVLAGDDTSELLPMSEVERRYIMRVLKEVKGNKTMAARILGFQRRTLYRKLDRYGLSDGRERQA
ncbi:MAG TPA: sigma-54 dependent transcriptional regulator [Kofleriaceae bacterium]|nr:sigma-54 dependent transcriptional regulator [Kofleriaceae bacterium]